MTNNQHISTCDLGMEKPYNPIRRFMSFVKSLAEVIEEALWEREDMPYEDRDKMYVYVDIHTLDIGIGYDRMDVPATMLFQRLSKFRADTHAEHMECSDIINLEALLSFAELCIPEGVKALNEFECGYKSYADRLSKPYNEIEDDPPFRRIEASVDNATKRICELRPADEFSDSIYQSVKKIILKERYLFDWKTTEELCGGNELPFDECLFDSATLHDNPQYKDKVRKLYSILNTVFRGEEKSLFGREAAHHTCERILQILFGIRWERPIG